MGDIPYKESEEVTLKHQMKNLTKSIMKDTTEDGIALFHLGDAMHAQRTSCKIEAYNTARDLFLLSPIPVFVTPGDNDWNDCPEPDVSWGRWSRNLMRLDENIKYEGHNVPIQRQKRYEENFEILHNGILIICTNLVAGSVLDEAVWDKRIENNVKFTTDLAKAYKGQYRGIILLGHSVRNGYMKGVYTGLKNIREPVLYIHGDGHNWEVKQPFKEDGWDNFWDIQVDQGGHAPPIKLTFRGLDHEAPLVVENEHQFLFGDMFLIDRRGGLYPHALRKASD